MEKGMSTSVTNFVHANPLPIPWEVFLVLQCVSRVSHVSNRPTSTLIQHGIDDIRPDFSHPTWPFKAVQILACVICFFYPQLWAALLLRITSAFSDVCMCACWSMCLSASECEHAPLSVYVAARVHTVSEWSRDGLTDRVKERVHLVKLKTFPWPAPHGMHSIWATEWTV